MPQKELTIVYNQGPFTTDTLSSSSTPLLKSMIRNPSERHLNCANIEIDNLTISVKAISDEAVEISMVDNKNNDSYKSQQINLLDPFYNEKVNISILRKTTVQGSNMTYFRISINYTKEKQEENSCCKGLTEYINWCCE